MSTCCFAAPISPDTLLVRQKPPNLCARCLLHKLTNKMVNIFDILAIDRFGCGEGAMGSVTIDVERAERYGLADAKAHLSDLVATVERTGEACIIMRYGRPTACITPVPEERAAPTQRAKGLLAPYANDDKRAREKGAFERAMAVKHGKTA